MVVLKSHPLIDISLWKKIMQILRYINIVRKTYYIEYEKRSIQSNKDKNKRKY